MRKNKRTRTWNEWARRVKASSGSTRASEWILDESWLDRAVMLEAFERLRSAKAARELREPAFPPGSFPIPSQLRRRRPAAIDVELAWEQYFDEILPEERALPAPPWIADFMLTMLARTPQREGESGCINELFNREVETLGAGRAARKYWARTCYFIWKILKRPFARAIKWGVILDLLRRYIS